MKYCNAPKGQEMVASLPTRGEPMKGRNRRVWPERQPSPVPLNKGDHRGSRPRKPNQTTVVSYEPRVKPADNKIPNILPSPKGAAENAFPGIIS
jgi:hypothetical protein